MEGVVAQTGLDQSTVDTLLIGLLAHERADVRHFSASALSWYGSHSKAVESALDKYMREQLAETSVWQLQPVFHERANNGLLLRVKLKVLKEIQESTTPDASSVPQSWSQMLMESIEAVEKEPDAG